MYIDASALLKLYVDEPESESCRTMIAADPEPASSIVSRVEVGRRLGLVEDDRRDEVQRAFTADWRRLNVVGLDQILAERAAEIAVVTGARSLDAIHLGAAERLGGPILTYDRRQADAARLLGLDVRGM